MDLSGDPTVVVTRTLPTLYYHCACGKLLDAGGLSWETWVICPSCDKAHLPPTTIDDVPKPPKKNKPKIQVVPNTGHKNGPIPASTKLGEVVDLETDAPHKTGPTFDPIRLEKSANPAPTNGAAESEPAVSRLRPPPRPSAHRDRLETISQEAKTPDNQNPSSMSWNEDEDDQIADFERSRKRKGQRRKSREGAIFRRVFFFALFVGICGWTAWKCYDDWDSVGASLILFLLCAGFSLYFAAADLVLPKDDD